MALRDRTKEQLIREGYRMLVQMCRCDHGCDLIAWRHELCETRAGGYRWGKRKGTPKNIENALADPTWRAAIEAPIADDALEWVYHVHGDFKRARTQHTDWQYDGTPIRDGEIEGEAIIEELLANNAHYATCKIGEYPN